MTDCSCGQPHAGLVCDGCHAQAYCGEACQRDDWAVHQQECVGGLFGLLRNTNANTNKKSLFGRLKDTFKKKTPEQQVATSAILTALPGLNDTSVENQIRNLLQSAHFTN